METTTTSTSNCASDYEKSDYEKSDDEIHTQCDSEEEDISERRMGSRGLVVNENTDFSTFQWKVGLRFPNKDVLKRALG